jgi:hypothetical protein
MENTQPTHAQGLYDLKTGKVLLAHPSRPNVYISPEAYKGLSQEEGEVSVQKLNCPKGFHEQSFTTVITVIDNKTGKKTTSTEVKSECVQD